MTRREASRAAGVRTCDAKQQRDSKAAHRFFRFCTARSGLGRLIVAKRETRHGVDPHVQILKVVQEFTLDCSQCHVHFLH